MRKYLGIYFVILILISLDADCQYPEVQQIDTSLKKCMSLCIKTTDFIDCISVADSSIDILLNKVYRQLLAQLKPDDKINLKKSQIQWLTYYQLETNFIHDSFATYANFSKYQTGMEQNIDNEYMIYNLKKQRVIQLLDYLLITSQNE